MPDSDITIKLAEDRAAAMVERFDRIYLATRRALRDQRRQSQAAGADHLPQQAFIYPPSKVVG
jgi:hypothetical protein